MSTFVPSHLQSYVGYDAVMGGRPFVQEDRLAWKYHAAGASEFAFQRSNDFKELRISRRGALVCRVRAATTLLSQLDELRASTSFI